MQNTLPTIWTIAKNNYKEIIRDRLLYGVLLIAVLATAFSFFAGSISLDQSSRVIQNIGIAAILLFTAFICIFTATTSISKDFERRTLYLLFPKPISRTSYVLGKYLGIVLLLLTTTAILGGIFELGAFFVDKSLVLDGLVNLFYIIIEVSLLSAFAVLFATFTAPMNAALYTIALFIIGHSTATLKIFAYRQGTSGVRHLVDACYYLLPNLEKFDVRQAILYGVHPTAGSVFWSLLYWALYTAVALFPAVRVMKNQEV